MHYCCMNFTFYLHNLGIIIVLNALFLHHAFSMHYIFIKMSYICIKYVFNAHYMCSTKAIFLLYDCIFSALELGGS
jgi:hypothetical protein